MARKTAGSSSPSRDADVPERKPRSSGSLKGRTTEPRAARNARAGTPLADDASPAVNWFDLFPSEDTPHVLPDEPGRVRQPANAGAAERLIAAPASQFYLSSSATSTEFHRDVRPRSLIIPSRFVDAKPPTSLATLVPPMTRMPSRRWPARRRRSMVWLASYWQRPARLMLGMRDWRSERSALLLGSLACLLLLGPSVRNRPTSTIDTIVKNHAPIASATEAIASPEILIPSSSLASGSSSVAQPGWLAPAVLSAPSAGSRPPAVAAPPPVARTSTTVQSSAKPATPARVHVIGTLVVTTEPAGAAVFMNQRYVGTTPLETSVKAGSYAVVLELGGARWTDVVLVRGERVTRLERSLQEPRNASVQPASEIGLGLCPPDRHTRCAPSFGLFAAGQPSAIAPRRRLP
jgi:hypothetical protein